MNTPNNSYFITNTDTLLTRWYVGSRYIKETEGSTTKEYTWIGGDAYTAVAVAKKVGTTTTVYNIFRDHLGTITHLKSGSTVYEYSFDAWAAGAIKTPGAIPLAANQRCLPGVALRHTSIWKILT